MKSAFCTLLLLLAAAQASASRFALPLPPLSVRGNQLVQVVANGTEEAPVRLRGVAGTGATFACIDGYAVFDGPTDVDNYMAGLHTWDIDIVRVPLNEDCWLGSNATGVPDLDPRFTGAPYRANVTAYVRSLVANGFYVIVDLHWTAAGTARATGQQPMPDREHTVPFWLGVAAALRDVPQAVFDVFNEPFPGNNSIDGSAAWACWKLGGPTHCPGLGYDAVGMDDLVAALRAPPTSSTHVLMLGGINYANSLGKWLEFAPVDPLNRLAASWHSYNFNFCTTAACWDATVAPVMAQVPVITGEIGENDCGGGYITPLMDWLDARNGTYLAWIWATWNCDDGPALISNYTNGVCTQDYGCTYKARLLQR